VLKALYQTFLDERRDLKNCCPKTLRSYAQAWNAFESASTALAAPADRWFRPFAGRRVRDSLRCHQ
jgi:hypothetical protein